MMEEATQELDLSIQELEVMDVMSGCSDAGMDPAACDASLGGAISLSIAGAAITVAVT